MIESATYLYHGRWARSTMAEYFKSPEAFRTSRDAMKVSYAARAEAIATAQNKAQKTSIIGVYGSIAPRGSWMLELCGGTSVEDLTERLNRAMNDPNVNRIVFDVYSGGGVSWGILEFGQRLRAARETKKIIAVAQPVAFSAAYWIAAQAGELYVGASGEVGSVGAYLVHEDWTAYLEKEGIKVEYITNPDAKVENAPEKALTDEARAEAQAQIDAIYAEFVRELALGRRVSEDHVRANFGGGRTVRAQEAVAAGMVDGIADLWDVLFGEAFNEPVNSAQSKTYMDLETERYRLQCAIRGLR